MPQVNIAPATGHQLYRHHYSPITVASLDFGEFLVSRFIECEKSDKWNHCQGDGFLRLAALDFPAYGRSFIKSAAFFVPYYQIIQNVDGFRSNLIADKGQPCLAPSIKADFLNQILGGDTSYSITVSNPQTLDDYDFSYCSNNSGAPSFIFKRLTTNGRRFYKFFKSLGYDFTMYNDANTYTSVMDAVPPINALNILCFAKIWTDYFCNIHLYQSSVLVSLLRSIKDGNNFSISGYSYYTANTGTLSNRAIESIFLETLVPIENTMYTNAWNSENSPIGDVSAQRPLTPSSLVGPHIPVNGGNTNNVNQDINSLFISEVSTGDLKHLSPFGINTMFALWDFVKRNDLSGSEPARQALARFGIKGDDINALFVRKLFEASKEIDYSAVLSNSNTFDTSTREGSVLGAYAGVGLSSLNFDYNYQCSDYGLIINISWLQIVPMQLHGFDPSVLRLQPFDWYTPQYDGKGIRAIPLMEVSTGKSQNTNTGNGDANVYGFIGLYDEMRQMRDVVLGDFVLGNAKKFVYSRDLSSYRDVYRFLLKPQNVGIQYFNRWGVQPTISDPFQFDASNGDRFYLQIKWNFDAERALLSDSASLDLGEGDVIVDTDANPNA